MVTGVTRRRGTALIAVFLVLLVLAGIDARAGHATASFSFTRFAGNDRYDTAAKVATGTFTKSDSVVIASGESYPDALAGSFAAGLASVPVLLVSRDDAPAPTLAALKTLGTTKAVIVGGTSAVSDVADQVLKANGVATTRVSGTSRYATAKAIAESGGATVVGKTGGVNGPAGNIGGNATAIVVSGEGFADALSAGPAAFAGHFPVLLTPTAALAPEAKAALQDLAIKTVLIVGGTSAVSQSVQDAITAMSITVTRIAGNDRSETAAKVADYALANLGFTNTKVDLARGDGFADALAGSAHAGKVLAPLLLTLDSETVGASTKDWLSAHASTLASGVIDGGPAAVSTIAESDATTAGRTTTTTTSSSTPTSLPITGPTTTTLPGVSTTLPGVSTTLPGVTTTLPGVSTTLPGGSTTSTSIAVTTTSTSVAPPPIAPPTLTPCPPGLVGPGQPFCVTPLPTPSQPAFAAAAAVERTLIVHVAYNEPVDCATVANETYTITVDAVGSWAVPTVTCAGPFNAAVTLELTQLAGQGYFQPGQTGAVTVANGAVKDANGKAQSKTDSITWALPAAPS